MAVLKFLFLTSLVLFLEVCNAAPTRSTSSSDHTVTITESVEMTARMKLDAVEVLKRALDIDSDSPCEILSHHFMETYPGYHWHCVNYNAYFIHRSKKIIMKTGDKKYLLFATVKH